MKNKNMNKKNNKVLSTSSSEISCTTNNIYDDNGKLKPLKVSLFNLSEDTIREVCGRALAACEKKLGHSINKIKL